MENMTPNFKLLKALQEIMDANQTKILAKIDANQAKTNVEMKAMQGKMDANEANTNAEMKADREQMLAKIGANQEKTDDKQEGINENLRKMREEIKSGQAEMKATINAIQEKMNVWVAEMKDGREERTALQETTEAYLDSREPNPEEIQSGAEHREAPKEHAAVKPVGGLRKRHRGRPLGAGRRGQPEERTRGNCGSWKKLVAAGRNITCRAGVARRKGCGHEGPSVEQGRRKNQTRDKIVRGTRKGRTLGRRQLTSQEGIKGTRNRDFQEQLRLGSERTYSGIYRKTSGFKIEK
jgi:hypothetical protein